MITLWYHSKNFCWASNFFQLIEKKFTTRSTPNRKIVNEFLRHQFKDNSIRGHFLFEFVWKFRRRCVGLRSRDITKLFSSWHSFVIVFFWTENPSQTMFQPMTWSNLTLWNVAPLLTFCRVLAYLCSKNWKTKKQINGWFFSSTFCLHFLRHFHFSKNFLGLPCGNAQYLSSFFVVYAFPIITFSHLLFLFWQTLVLLCMLAHELFFALPSLFSQRSLCCYRRSYHINYSYHYRKYFPLFSQIEGSRWVDEFWR